MTVSNATRRCTVPEVKVTWPIVVPAGTPSAGIRVKVTTTSGRAPGHLRPRSAEAVTTDVDPVANVSSPTLSRAGATLSRTSPTSTSCARRKAQSFITGSGEPVVGGHLSQDHGEDHRGHSSMDRDHVHDIATSGLRGEAGLDSHHPVNSQQRGEGVERAGFRQGD